MSAERTPRCGSCPTRAMSPASVSRTAAIFAGSSSGVRPGVSTSGAESSRPFASSSAVSRERSRGLCQISLGLNPPFFLRIPQTLAICSRPLGLRGRTRSTSSETASACLIR
jgi:hypothetical protein